MTQQNAKFSRPLSYSISSVSQQNNGKPASNINNDFRGLVWETSVPGASGGNPGISFVVLDLGSVTEVDDVYILGGPNQYRWAVTGSANDPSVGNPVWGYNGVFPFSSNGSGTRKGSIPVPSPVGVRYVGVTVFNDTPSVITVSLFRVLVCQSISPGENIQVGASFGVDDRSVRRYTRAGRRVIDPASVNPSFAGSWPWLTETEKNWFTQDTFLHGGTDPAVFFLDPGDTTYGENGLIYGDLEKTTKITYDDGCFGYDLGIVSVTP